MQLRIGIFVLLALSTTAALVEQVEGLVWLRPAGHERWSPIAETAELAEGDALRTGSDGKAAVGETEIGPHVTAAWQDGQLRTSQNVVARPPTPMPGNLPGPAKLVACDVRVDIRDQIARTAVTQTYRNDGKEPLEGNYSFTLPPDAAVAGFVMDGIHADIVDKERGREIFETIKSEKRDPALLEWRSGGTFTARVHPIAPGQSRELRIIYTQFLPGIDGKFRYHFPLRTPQLDRVSIDVSLRPAADFTTSLGPGKAGRFVWQGDTGRDFELIADSATEPRMIRYEREGDGWFMAMHPQTSSRLPEGKPLELVLLCDTSASIGPAKREQRERFLEAFLGSLGPKDRVRFAAFDLKLHWLPDVEALRARSCLGPTNLKEALAQIEGKVVYVGDEIVDGVESVNLNGDGRQQAIQLVRRLLGPPQPEPPKYEGKAIYHLPGVMLGRYEPDGTVEATDNSYIARLWARQHLDHLIKTKADRDSIIAHSARYHLLSPHTSLLILESDADRKRFAVQQRLLMRDGHEFFRRETAFAPLRDVQPLASRFLRGTSYYIRWGLAQMDSFDPDPEQFPASYDTAAPWYIMPLHFDMPTADDEPTGAGPPETGQGWLWSPYWEYPYDPQLFPHIRPHSATHGLSFDTEIQIQVVSQAFKAELVAGSKGWFLELAGLHCWQEGHERGSLRRLSGTGTIEKSDAPPGLPIPLLHLARRYAEMAMRKEAFVYVETPVGREGWRFSEFVEAAGQVWPRRAETRHHIYEIEVSAVSQAAWEDAALASRALRDDAVLLTVPVLKNRQEAEHAEPKELVDILLLRRFWGTREGQEHLIEMLRQRIPGKRALPWLEALILGA